VSTSLLIPSYNTSSRIFLLLRVVRSIHSDDCEEVSRNCAPTTAGVCIVGVLMSSLLPMILLVSLPSLSHESQCRRYTRCKYVCSDTNVRVWRLRRCWTSERRVTVAASFLGGEEEERGGLPVVVAALPVVPVVVEGCEFLLQVNSQPPQSLLLTMPPLPLI